MKSPTDRIEPTIHHVWEARRRIASTIKKTPLIYSFILSERIGRPVYLKLENVHDIGAFKVRGAANKILSLSDNEMKKGIATFSTGNHGMAVAYVALKLGIEAIVCISNRVPKDKVESLKKLGAKIEFCGDSQDEAAERCKQLELKSGVTTIPPFDDPDIIAGQGTIGLEILEDVPNLTDVVIPLSGGGLLSGIGLALKSNNTGVGITGVSMEHFAVMYESLKVGYPVKLAEGYTLADSLLGGIGANNQYTFSMVQKYMDTIYLISEKQIENSMVFMMKHHRMIVEGAAATTVAAILEGKVHHQKGAIVAIISGSNVDFSILEKIIKSKDS